MKEELIIEKIKTNLGKTVKNTFIKQDYLGKGGFAVCYKVIDSKTKQPYALKIINKSEIKTTRQKKKLLQEIQIHSELNHERIVKFHRPFEDEDCVYLLLELCRHKTLDELIQKRKRLTELEVRYYGKQILDGLRYLREQKIIHRDLKLGNLFLGEGLRIKIGDFGLATVLKNQLQLRKTVCGTPNFIAPEIVNSRKHSFEVDLWSFGIVIYTLLVGKSPFESDNINKTYEKIKRGKFSFPDYFEITKEAKNLLLNLLKVNQYQRLKIFQAMQHPFFLVGGLIPRSLPLDTLVNPPRHKFIRKYMDLDFLEHNKNIYQGYFN